MDESIFKHPDEFMPGYVSYEAESSHESMTAVRRLVDRDWGRKWNTCEMLERQAGRFDPYMLFPFEKRWVFSGKKHVIMHEDRLESFFDLSFSSGMYQRQSFALPDTRIYRAFLARHEDYVDDEYTFVGNDFGKYAMDPDWRVRRAAFRRFFGKGLANNNQNKDIVRIAAEDPSMEVRLESVFCSSVCLAVESAGGLHLHQMVFCMNPLLECLLDDRSDVVRCAAALKCMPTAENASKIMETGSVRMKRYFAERSDGLPAEVLVVLAEHCDDPEARASLMLRAMEAE